MFICFLAGCLVTKESQMKVDCLYAAVLCTWKQKQEQSLRTLKVGYIVSTTTECLWRHDVLSKATMAVT
jgi:hypothetical protein